MRRARALDLPHAAPHTGHMSGHVDIRTVEVPESVETARRRLLDRAATRAEFKRRRDAGLKARHGRKLARTA